MATRGKAPRQITFILCLAAYVLAVLAHFNIIQVRADVATWSWILGYGVLLLAIQIRGL